MVSGNLRPPLDTTGTPYYYGEIRSRLQDTALYMGIAVTGQRWVRIGSTGTGGGSGTVTQVASGWGITLLPDPIVETGFVGVDSFSVTSRNWHQKGMDSLGALITNDTANLIFDTVGTGISAVFARNDTLFTKAFKATPTITWSTDTDSSMLAKVDTTHGNASAAITWGNFYRIINDSLTFGGGSYTFDWGLTEAATVVNVDSFEVASFLRLKKVADSLGALAGSTTIYNGNGSLDSERLIDQADFPIEISNLGSNGIATKFRLIPWEVDTGSRAEIQVRGDTTLDVFTRITATAQSTEAAFTVEAGYSTTVAADLELTAFSGDPRFQVHLEGGDPGIYFNYGHLDNPDSNKLVIPFTASTTDTVVFYNTITGQLQRRLVSSSSGSGVPSDSVKYYVRHPTWLISQALGSTVKFESLGRSMADVTTTVPISDGQIRFFAIYISETTTITGVKWFQATQGSYTADNYNGIGLYSYSGGTLTQVASTTDDGDIWKATGSTMASKAFSSTYNASPGVYFIAVLYNSSAQTTAPALGGYGTTNAGVSAADYTNSAKLISLLSGQTALPSPTQAMSGLTVTTAGVYLALY